MNTTNYLVTGANRGLGLEFVTQIAALSSTKVFATARNLDSATALKDLAARHKNIELVCLDVGSPDSVKEAAALLSDKLGDAGLDVLIANAGKGGSNKPLLEQTQEDFDSTLSTNVTGTFLTVQAFLPLVRRSGQKKIILLSSILGSIATDGGAQWGEYAVSKAAVNMLGVQFARDLKSDGIIVINLHPGWVQTDMGSSFGDAPLTAHESISGSLSVIRSISIDSSGEYIGWDGNKLPW